MRINFNSQLSALVSALCVAASLNLNAAPGDGLGLSDLSEAEVADLVFMREEEKLARDSYLVMMEKWGVTVFGNIANSEQRHMDAIESLIETYGLSDPVGDESAIGQYVDPELLVLFEDLMELGDQSILDGLVVGAMIEETDIEDIQAAINWTTHADVIGTYEALLCGSRNHLRAFVGQIEFNGGVYTPTLLTDVDFSAIVDTPTERDCGTLDVSEATGTNKPRRKGWN